jgi:hypothetical protein
MSVHQRRFAAAQKTAAPKSGSRSRLKLTATWLTIATALSFFTFTVVATAANSEPDYAGAANQLPQDGRLVVITSGQREVCSVNASQLDVLESRYDVGRMTVEVDGVPGDFATVGGANDHELRTLLGYVDCKLVKEKHVFYLPFDANVS